MRSAVHRDDSTSRTAVEGRLQPLDVAFGNIGSPSVSINGDERVRDAYLGGEAVAA